MWWTVAIVRGVQMLLEFDQDSTLLATTCWVQSKHRMESTSWPHDKYDGAADTWDVYRA